MKRISCNRWIRWWPLAAVLLAACAGSPPQKSPPPATAAKSGSADELAARALISWATGGAGASPALTQIQQAVESAPQQPELLWLNVRICADVPGCEPSAIEAHLRDLDPGNGAVWLGPLLRAQARKDARAVDEILEVMGQADHVNVYWTTLVARLTPPISRSPVALAVAQAEPTPLTNALNITISYLSRLDTPALSAIATACDALQVREPGRRVRCDRVARVLQRSDTTLAEGIGLGIEQRLAAPASMATMQVIEKINTLRHQSQAAGEVVAAQVEQEKFSAQMLKLMDQLGREQDVSRAILRWAGQPLSP